MKNSKIVITDSGLGGLDIAARLFEKLKIGKIKGCTEVIFVNALPEHQSGYNKMPDLGTKIKTFNDVLFGIEKHFQPAYIGIACNTLSAISASTDFYKLFASKLINIIDLGVQSFKSIYGNEIKEPIVIFGTETTIKSRTYQNLLRNKGFEKNLIISEICSQLASEIELDYSSLRTKTIIKECVSNVTKRLSGLPKGKLFVFLACTHYGYVANIFKETFADFGYRNLEIINPNDYLVNELLTLCKNTDSPDGHIKKELHVSIKVYSRSKILPEEIESISKLIQPYSPATVFALKKYIRKKDLF